MWEREGGGQEQMNYKRTNEQTNEQTKEEELYVDRCRRPVSWFWGVEVDERGKLGKEDGKVAAVLLVWVVGAVQRGSERKTDNKKIYLELVWVLVGELGHTQCLKNKINDGVGGGRGVEQ